MAQRNFLDIPTAAYQAGYNTRDFRKIIQEDRIPTIQIGHRTFILATDLEAWSSAHGEARLDDFIKQLDRWLQEEAARTPEPVPAWDDEE